MELILNVSIYVLGYWELWMILTWQYSNEKLSNLTLSLTLTLFVHQIIALDEVYGYKQDIFCSNRWYGNAFFDCLKYENREK